MNDLSQGPLAGVLVLDLSRTLAGTHASTVLADLGAEVIGIEPSVPSPGRIGKASMPGTTFGGVDARYNYQTRGKKSLTLDIMRPKGRHIFQELVKRADVVLYNYRPAVVRERGLEHEALKEINPRIITCSITGWGSSGPYKDRSSYDTIAQAASGLMSITGEPGGPPCLVSAPIADTVTALYAAHAITAALFARERTGQGQKVETSVLGAAVNLLSYMVTVYDLSGVLPRAGGAAMPYIGVSGAFPTKDGYLATGVIMERHWRPFCRALGHEDLAEDPRFESETRRVEHGEELWSLLRGVFLTRTNAEWEERLMAEDIPVSPVNTIDDLIHHPQILHQGLVVTVDGAHGQPLRMVGNPMKFSAMKRQDYRRAPALGESTDQILGDLLGYSKEEIAALRSERVV